MTRRISISVALLGLSGSVFAQPRAEDIFKSIQTNLDNSSDPTALLATVGAVVLLVIGLLVFNRRRTNEAVPKALNHPGKLIKEISRQVDLKPGEIRQLKILSDHEGLSSPLTLLLCPSVLAKAARDPGAKRVDRAAIARALQRVGRTV